MTCDLLDLKHRLLISEAFDNAEMRRDNEAIGSVLIILSVIEAIKICLLAMT